MSDPSLGLVMILRDEEANLPRSLAPVAALFDEVVAVDTGSHDNTARLAASLGARVYHFDWVDDFAAARNLSLERAQADWLLWLDGDNALEPDQIPLLRQLLPAQPAAVLWAQELVVSSGERLWQKRCFPRLPQVRFSGRVHEQLSHPAHWGSVFTPLVIRHWGYVDRAKALAKGDYYLSILEQMLQHDPGDYYAHFQTGRCLFNKRSFQLAAQHFALAAHSPACQRANPQLWLHSHLQWAMALERQGLPQQAVSILEQLLEAEPGAGLAHFALGKLAWSQGNWQQAALSLQRALALDLEQPLVDGDPLKVKFQAAYYLGLARLELGQAQPAAQAFARALELDPGHLAAQTQLARALLGLGQAQPARAILEHLLEHQPSHRPAQELLRLAAGAA